MIDVALFTVNDAAAVAPKLTAVAPVKPVPVIVTEVPPAVGPLVGLTLVTVGAARNVNWSAGAGCAGAIGCGDGDVDRARSVRGGRRGDRRRVVHGERRRGGCAEADCGGAGEAGAGDRHRCAARRRVRWSGSRS